VKKELEMSFEKEVLAKVATVLKDDNAASFFCGSLSVICTENEARKIFHKLAKDYKNKVQVSKDGSYGYIYDFIA
jgi:hypothetical protein